MTSNTTTHPETEIVADDTVPAVRMTREFNAPVSSVFRAHTDPALYARWIGPHELTTTIGEWDCRTGGEWSYSSTDADGNAYDFFGSFHEVRPNELVVQTFTYAGFPDGVSLERLTFQDLGSGRCRIVAVSLLDSFESRDMMIASGMEIGIKEGYEKLDDLLAAEDSTD